MTDIDKAALLAELVAMSSVERQQPGDVTIADFIEADLLERRKRNPDAAPITRQTATRWLQALVVKGFLTAHKVQLTSGVIGWVYRDAKAETAG